MEVELCLRACSSKGRNGIPGRNISSWGRKSDLKICPEAETIRPKMTNHPLAEQALNSFFINDGSRMKNNGRYNFAMAMT